MKASHWFVWSLLGASFVPACGGGGSESLEQQKVIYIAGFGESVMLPALTRSGSDIAVLNSAVADLAAELDATGLERCQQAWRSARLSWSRAEMVMFDQLEDLRFVPRMDAWDVALGDVEAEISGTSPLNVERMEALGSQMKGFHAVEYLLFAPDPKGQVPLLALQTDGRRLDYLRSVSEDLTARMSEAVSVGLSLTESYELADLEQAQSALEKLVNFILFVTEQLADRGLGRPLGNTLGGIPQVPGVESPHSEHSLQDLESDVAGLRAVWEGSDAAADPYGLKRLVAVWNPQDSALIDRKLERLEDALGAIEGSLLGAAEDRRESVELAFERAKDLKLSLQVSLPNVLDVIEFVSPFDGD